MGAGTADYLKLEILKIAATVALEDYETEFDNPVKKSSVNLYVKISYGDNYKAAVGDCPLFCVNF